MDKQFVIKIAQEFVRNSDFNYISKNIALTEQLTGMKIFEEPIFAFGSADDDGFNALKEPSAMGEHFLLPKEWLPNANTVISYFFPFTDDIIKSNRYEKHWPSNEWLHGRIEGQNFIKEFSQYLNSKLIDSSYDSIVPTLDMKFWSSKEESEIHSFSSNWSERHVAFVCGLGTFGLSKGIITEKGMAGRLGSIVTQLKLEPDNKRYTGVYEYCTMCGACARKCPVNAISLDNGKDHKKCSDFLDITAEKYKPRYGCGKCQVSVPCERKIP
ncbi:MAG: 4Fe-4S binding protein [Sedimentibacter sp.]